MLDKETWGGIVAIILALAGGWKARAQSRADAAKAEAAKAEAARPRPPLEIPEMRPGDDPAITVNRLIRIIVTEHADREAETLAHEAQQKADRKKFHELYTNLANEQNRDRAEIQTLRGDLGEARKALDAERLERRKLSNELAKESKERVSLDSRLTKVQGELTIALTDNTRLIRENETLTADNADLRRVNGELLAVVAEQRQTLAAKDERIDQLVETLEGLRGELELSTQLLQKQVDKGETGGMING